MSDELVRFTGTVEIAAAAATGRHPAISIVAYDGRYPMRVANYPAPVLIDLTRADVSGDITLLSGHGGKLGDIIGTGRASIEDSKIIVRGVVATGTPAGDQAVSLFKSGVRLQASVGYTVGAREHVTRGDVATVNGVRHAATEPEGLIVARSGKLVEVSLVPIGANPGTSVSIAAKGTSMTTDNNTVTGEPTAFERVQARWEQERWHDPEGGPRQRAQAAMMAAAAGRVTFEDFERTLLVERLRDVELKLLRAELPKGPVIRASGHDNGDDIVAAAFGIACGVAEKHYRPEVLEAADRAGLRGIGLQEVLLRAAAQAGNREHRTIRGGNLRDVLRAAFSVHSLTTILSDTGNKILIDGFGAGEQAWKEIAKVRSVPDFKETKSYRLTSDLQYDEVGPGGEIHHGTLSQETVTHQAKTYAKMLSLTRTDILNDNLGAFNDLKTRLGLGAALKLNEVFWTAWLAASAAGTFWTSGRGNLQTSSGLADSTISSGVKLFRSMKDADGAFIGLVPKILLCPPELEATARKFFAATEVRDTTASTKFATANIHQGLFKPVVSAYLSATALTGYSGTSWWLVADPAVVASVDVCFLNGVQTPTIESTDADFETLGISWRGYWDFGVAVSEYRASVKSEA